MKKGRLKEIVAELQAASKMHLKQSKEIEAHIDDMGSPAKVTDQETRMQLEEMDGIENENTKNQKGSGNMSYNGTFYNDDPNKGAVINDPDKILNDITDKQYKSGYKYRTEEDGSRTLEPGR